MEEGGAILIKAKKKALMGHQSDFFLLHANLFSR